MYYESQDNTMTFNDTERRKDGSLPPFFFTNNPRLTSWDIYALEEQTVS
jgi:hypothetical protein